MITKNRARAQLFKREFIDLLGGKCIKCGIADPRVLTFDHVNPEDKRYELSRMFGRNSRELIYEEVKKCQLLCANCHMIKTIEERDCDKNAAKNRPSPRAITSLPPIELHTGEGICPWCGTEFQIRKRFPTQKWCSMRCKKRFADAQWKRRVREQVKTEG